MTLLQSFVTLIIVACLIVLGLTQREQLKIARLHKMMLANLREQIRDLQTQIDRLSE